MNLFFDLKLADGFRNNSQIARILTENWVLNNSYCPSCGNTSLNDFENNRPVADFYCKKCSEEFELKSKSGKLTNTIPDGAYSTMIERISSENNPNFFFLSYTKDWSVDNFLIIPKQFFTEGIIIKRPPLASSAKRAGWVGCNIDIANIAESGKVFLVKNSKIVEPEAVTKSFNKTIFLRQKSSDAKGWILDIMKCVDEIKPDVFNLDELYKFEPNLKLKYPNNNFIRDKIRQQLQVLRDKGFVEFVGRGQYKKLKNENI
jgi:type II restriction enzyme